MLVSPERLHAAEKITSQQNANASVNAWIVAYAALALEGTGEGISARSATFLLYPARNNTRRAGRRRVAVLSFFFPRRILTIMWSEWKRLQVQILPVFLLKNVFHNWSLSLVHMTADMSL